MAPSSVQQFVIALNPEEDTKLPYLLRLPLEGGMTLKTRDTWPRASRLYCHPFDGPWPEGSEIVEETPVVVCRRRGASIDLVLARPKLSRSQFVFTQVRGRPAIFWQTQKAAMASSPGARIPRGPRSRAPDEPVTIFVDSRERYPFRFAGRAAGTERIPLAAGDYGMVVNGALAAVVERKTFEDFVACLSDGTLAFQCQRLAEVPAAAVVVEGRYANLFRLEHVSGAWIADMLVRLQLRYPEVQIVFADSRKFAEDWTYRFLVSALDGLPPAGTSGVPAGDAPTPAEGGVAADA